MFAWNSPLNIGFDILCLSFSIIPFVAVSALALISALVSIPTLITTLFVGTPKNAQDLPTLSSNLLVGLVGLFGLLGSLSVIYVTFTRGNTPAKPWFITAMGLGILASLVAPNFLAPLTEKLGMDLFTKLFIAAEIPLVIVAIKHIVMLTRANA